MKRTFLAAIIVFISIALTGCGGGGSSAPATVFSTQILSDPTLDGDITVPVSGPIVIAQGNTQSVFAGINPFTLGESRAFLDFPLTGPGGVPGNAAIVSATLDIVITNIILPTQFDTVPLRIDLVSFPQPMIATDFNVNILPPLASITISPGISSADVGNHVLIDVTSLMVSAQNLGLLNFQIRILEDLGPVTPGLIEINDTTGLNRVDLAPLLRVDFL